MDQTPREKAEERSKQPEDIQPNPESQNDPPSMPTLEQQHEEETPHVDADTLAERIADRDANLGSAEGEPDPGVEEGSGEYRGNKGGFPMGEEGDEAQTGRRPVPGDRN